MTVLSPARIGILVLMLKVVKRKYVEMFRKSREKKQLTQQELADKSGFSLRQVKRIEKGDLSQSMIKTIEFLRALGLIKDDEKGSNDWTKRE